MYIPKAFQETDPKIIKDFIYAYPFAILISPQSGDITHLPLLENEEGLLECHLAKANPHSRTLLTSPETLAIFQGPHAYISPQFYGAPEQAVPTWNYAAVHLHGKAAPFSSEKELSAYFTRLTQRFERKEAPIWTPASIPEEMLSSLSKAVLGFSIRVEKTEAKFKLGQNRTERDREGIELGLERASSAEGRAYATFVRDYFKRNAPKGP